MLRVVASTAFRQAARNVLVPGQTAARSFAKAAAPADDADWQPKGVKLHGVPARYAGALYTAAGKGGVIAAVEKEIAEIGKMTGSSEKFQAFLSDPTIPIEKKVGGMRDLLTQGKFSETTINFFSVVAENGRLAETEKIAHTFADIMMAHRGEVKAMVTSAEALEAKQVDQLSEIITKRFLEKGQTIKLTTKVDPSIIGGLVVDVGDKNIDLSVNTKIRKMENILMESV
mmetsp:Transcript_53790/g.170863  ORF Transcript_53790/g.170863 Transcript_53790/m.170863 type:complete len:229 (-) Transcript_53790:69-755(-)